MIAYIYGSKTFELRDIVEVSDFEAVQDTSYTQVSTVVLPYGVELGKGDFLAVYKDEYNQRLLDRAKNTLTNATGDVLIRNPRVEPEIFGICDEVTDNNGAYDVTLTQPQNLFNQIVLDEKPELLATSAEAYLEFLINRNFADPTDAAYQLPYLSIRTYSTTPVPEIYTENGVVNLRDVMSRLLIDYRVMVRMVPDGSTLIVQIYRDQSEPTALKSDQPDVSSYEATKQLSITSKITVRWKLRDFDGSIGAYTYPMYYLLNNSSVVEKNDLLPTDIMTDGSATVINVTAATIGEVREKVVQEFSRNVYERQANVSVLKDGLWNATAYYAGMKVRIFDRYGSAVATLTEVRSNSYSPTLELMIGSLPLTLTDKIRRMIDGNI